MRRRDHHDHGRFGEREITDAVQERDALDVGPTPSELVGDLSEPARRLLFVCLVREPAHTGPAIGVLAHDPDEGDDCAAARRGDPGVGSFDGKRQRREGDPVASVRGREHETHRTAAPH